jgi:NAD-dependent SIR2 family protein deacetylase
MRDKARHAITQNIDNLQQASGIPAEKLIEQHGWTTYATCLDCNRRYEIAALREIFEKAAMSRIAPAVASSRRPPFHLASRCRNKRWSALASRCNL